MFVYTMSKKRALRVGVVLAIVFVGIAIGVAAILTAVNTEAAENKLPIYSVDRGDNKIAVTFDCAWGNSNTDELLSMLDKENVKATFFVTGEFCDKFPEDVKKFADAGHDVQNHSDKHPHIKGIKINDLINDTKECAKKIKAITGKEPTLYRAPYGEFDDNAITTLEGMGYKVIQWSVDSIDWQEPDAATIVRRIKDNTVSGSILLFHNDLANTTEALPVVLRDLRKAGYDFSKISDMIYYENYHMDNAGKQIYDVNVLSNNVVTYTNNAIANDALNIIRTNLTAEEIKTLDLSGGFAGNAALMKKIHSLLSEEQLRELSNLPTEEAQTALAMLMTTSIEASATIHDPYAVAVDQPTIETEEVTDPAVLPEETIEEMPDETTAPEETALPKGANPLDIVQEYAEQYDNINMSDLGEINIEEIPFDELNELINSSGMPAMADINADTIREMFIK